MSRNSKRQDGYIPKNETSNLVVTLIVLLISIVVGVLVVIKDVSVSGTPSGPLYGLPSVLELPAAFGVGFLGGLLAGLMLIVFLYRMIVNSRARRSRASVVIPGAEQFVARWRHFGAGGQPHN